MLIMILSTLYSVFSELFKISPPGLVPFVAPVFQSSSLASTYKNEFFATLIMIGLTFAPGKWIAVTQPKTVVWAVHALTVIAADVLGGGQHVNPAMTLAMVSMNKCTGGLSEAYTRISGQMAGGLISFPLFHLFSSSFHLNSLGGPDYARVSDNNVSAVALLARNEFFATFWLCIAVCVLNFQCNFGKYHYWVKQTMTAVIIRVLIETFSTTGPAMNPMLGTAWSVFAYGSFPTYTSHYFIYWISSILGALVGALIYTLYAGGIFCGKQIKGLKSSKQVAPVKKKKQ